MSKVLKFIVNLVVLLSIVVAAALLVPPLLGVDTVINDNSNIETNLPVGAVAYGKQVDTEGLKKEDKIIYIEGSAQYVYEIQDMDTTAGAYKVKDVYNKNSDVESITLQDKVSKAVVTIPFIGYAAIALQSKTGLMVVGAVIVLLIILFILSEVLRRGDDEDEEDDEEEEPGYWERRRLRKEEKRRQKEAEYEEDDEKEEQEETEELFVPEDTSSEAVSSESPQELQGFDEAMKDAMSSIASGIAQVSEPENVPDATVIMPDAEEIEKAVQETEETSMMVEALEEQEVAEEVETETEEALETNEEQINEEQINEEILEADEEPISEEAENDVPEDITEDIIIEETQTEVFAEEENPVNVNAVPKTPSIDELLAKAAEAGEQPEVKKDEENEVTLLDYSDLL